jgi:hypothetical protein
MVNPSTADATEDDATIRKLKGFCARQGWRGFVVVNIHAFRATDVNELKRAVDPVGPLNGGFILGAILKTDVTVCAWGSLGKLPPHLRNGWRSVVSIAKATNRPLLCWDVCADGQPKHPVMLGYCDAVAWEPPQ